jgi:hypothetical protein
MPTPSELMDESVSFNLRRAKYAEATFATRAIMSSGFCLPHLINSGHHFIYVDFDRRCFCGGAIEPGIYPDAKSDGEGRPRRAGD